MIVHALLAEAERAGVRLFLGDAGEIRYAAEASPPPRLLDELRAHKEQIRAALERDGDLAMPAWPGRTAGPWLLRISFSQALEHAMSDAREAGELVDRMNEAVTAGDRIALHALSLSLEARLVELARHGVNARLSGAPSNRATFAA